MSESEPAIETVVIPSELALKNPAAPSVVVSLPIVARSAELKNCLLGLFFLAGGMFALLCGVLIGMPVFVFWRRAVNVGMSIWEVLLLLVLVPMLILAVRWGVGCTVAALTCFRDAARNGPALEITADGLRDYRSGLSVPWSSVQCARIANSGIDGVILQLREPVKHWQNPFRLDVQFQGYRPKPDHVLVSAAHLDVPSHVLIHTILSLTQTVGWVGRSETHQ
ncbi:hypothetical protein CQ14_34375 [Bradyrhizobium lablabi]|uniref:Uncharacterized protein n=1 Tax=Bradyrhizobium lablabi TaxID=722472 RepID=A0A0R3N5F8_9BRAD|nr:hypothetical protein [Bradyrhizobium lablabi]KRR27290.1 hypothetical protein CQ14_34375 [Bradyrhizobium lablabi]